MVRRRPKNRKLAKKRIIRSSRHGSTGDVVDGALNTPASETTSNGITVADYRNWLGDNEDIAAAQTEVSESYAKAQELIEMLRNDQFGMTRGGKVKKLLDVIDARFKELHLARVASRKSWRQTDDVNQTSLFTPREEKHD